MKKINIKDKVKLLDDLDSHCSQIGEIINIKSGPFGQGFIYDIKFEDGYILSDVIRNEFEHPVKIPNILNIVKYPIFSKEHLENEKEVSSLITEYSQTKIGSLRFEKIRKRMLELGYTINMGKWVKDKL